MQQTESACLHTMPIANRVQEQCAAGTHQTRTRNYGRQALASAPAPVTLVTLVAGDFGDFGDFGYW